MANQNRQQQAYHVRQSTELIFYVTDNNFRECSNNYIFLSNDLVSYKKRELEPYESLNAMSPTKLPNPQISTKRCSTVKRAQYSCCS